MTPEQQFLLAKARDNLRAAQLLADEGLYDFAVSRAYYTFLLSENLPFSKHSAVISKFGEYFAQPGLVPSQFHRYLIQAEQSRVRADYDAAFKASAIEATEQINRAAEFISLGESQLETNH